MTRRRRIAVVAPIMVRYDAISLAARDTVQALAADPSMEVRHFGAACEFSEIAHRPVHDVADLLLDPEYQVADAAIFHFGIHHGLFDALHAGGPRIRIVRFHNVTPARFVVPGIRAVIERSLQQIETLRLADEIWADSAVNAKELLDRGFDPDRVRTIPLVVEDPVPANLQDKRPDRIELLFMGRIAPSKGVHDLLAAMALAALPPGVARLTVAGNMAWSEPGYVRQLHALIEAHGLAGSVRFAGTVDDAERERLFHASHVLIMPSYHEGFCRPVAEGLRAGCIPLVYDAYNLPFIAAGLGRVVPPGDVPALTAEICRLVRSLPAALHAPAEPILCLDRGPTSVVGFDQLAAEHVAAFSSGAVGHAVRTRLSHLVC